MRPLSEWPQTDDPETVEWRAWFCRRMFVVVDGDGEGSDPVLPLLSLVPQDAASAAVPPAPARNNVEPA